MRKITRQVSKIFATVQMSKSVIVRVRNPYRGKPRGQEVDRSTVALDSSALPTQRDGPRSGTAILRRLCHHGVPHSDGGSLHIGVNHPTLSETVLIKK
jgi:hypothetical protein